MQNPKIKKKPTSKIQKSKNPKKKIQNFSHLRNLANKSGFLDFSVFRLFEFRIFGISGSVALWLCGYLGTKKCISACRRGVSIYIYIHIFVGPIGSSMTLNIAHGCMSHSDA